MIQLNLLPDVKKEFLKTQRLKRNIISASLLIVIVVVGLVVLLAMYVHGFQPFARNQLQDDIDNYTSELQQTPDINEMLTVQNALAALPELHDNSLRNSRMFNYLTVVVPNGVGLSRLNIEHEAKTITITGTASDYKTLNVFVDTLKNAQFEYTNSQNQKQTSSPFSKVTIENAASATGNETGISFNLVMEYDEAIFDRKVENPAMTVPNVTVRQGFVAPENLFDGAPTTEEETAQ